MLATQLERPIVPITINGSYDVFNREDTMVNRHSLELIIHKPIPCESFKGKNTKILMKEVFDIIHDDLKLSPRNTLGKES